MNIENSLRQPAFNYSKKPAIKCATGEWIELKKKTPKPGCSYLIRCMYAGPCYDVAFYEGVRKDGSHHWIVTKSDINPDSITHYAHIRDPDSLED